MTLLKAKLFRIWYVVMQLQSLLYIILLSILENQGRTEIGL